MEWVSFVKQYIKSPTTVGAVAPSSKKLASKMVENIDFQNCKCILEYGPGTGVFTEEIIRNKKKETLFIALEYNDDFYKHIRDKYSGIPNFIIIHDSAEYTDQYLKKLDIDKVDIIISGLPFTSLPKTMSTKILEITKKILKSEGQFITFQYSLLKINLFKEYFKEISLKKVLFNFPPAYVLNCSNKEE